MKNLRAYRQTSSSGEENPFWISYSDLMTAAMIIFMTIMAITMALIGQTAPPSTVKSSTPATAEIMRKIQVISEKYGGISVDTTSGVIDIGELMRFGRGQSSISPQAGATLREFVKEVLAQQELSVLGGQIKNIVVEGYADQDGSYLYNLQLSLNRSQSVVCALLDPERKATVLDDTDRDSLRQLLMVGGFSSNSLRASKELSRRVELKIVMSLAAATSPSPVPRSAADIGNCTRA